MNAFHYEPYLQPDLSTLSASARFFVSRLCLFVSRFFLFRSSRWRRGGLAFPEDTTKKGGKIGATSERDRGGNEEEGGGVTLSPGEAAQPPSSLYLSTARFIVGKPADFFSRLLESIGSETQRPVSRVRAETIIRRIFRLVPRTTVPTRAIPSTRSGVSRENWRTSRPFRKSTCFSNVPRRETGHWCMLKIMSSTKNHGCFRGCTLSRTKIFSLSMFNLHR